MKKINKPVAVLLFLFALLSGRSFAQPGIVADGIIAVVGDQIILKSDLERALVDYSFPDSLSRNVASCEIVYNLVFQKLLLHKALVDSIKISDDVIDNELNRRIKLIVNQMGGDPEQFKLFYGKSISEIKDEMREPMREMKLAEAQKTKIIGNFSVSPAQVKNFYRNIPEDSLPYYNTEVEVAQIVIWIKPTDEEDKKALDKITEIRNRIIKGAKFENMAILYSDDISTATKGGDLGMRNKFDFVPEFASAAMRLKKDSVSEIIKTSYGYHILKLVDRKGEKVHVKHILIIPKITQDARYAAMRKLDDIARLIKADSITFEAAALKYSQDDETKNNGGLIVDAESGSTRIPLDQLEPSIFYVIDTLKTGTFAGPVSITAAGAKEGYRLIYLKSRTLPHKANLEDDYPKIKALAEESLQVEILEKWMMQTLKGTYLEIKEPYSDCEKLNKLLKVKE